MNTSLIQTGKGNHLYTYVIESEKPLDIVLTRAILDRAVFDELPSLHE